MTHRRRLLTKERQKWAAERGGAEFHGAPLSPSAAPRIRMNDALARMVVQMHRAAMRDVVALYKRPIAPQGFAEDASFTELVSKLFRRMRQRFDGLFGSRSLSIAKVMQDSVNKTSAGQLKQSLKEVSGGLTIKTDVIQGPVAEAMKAGVKEGVSLIKSIPAKYFEDLEGIVYRSIQSGRGMADLVPQIEKLGHSTRKRAELIARDQTSKATTALNRARMDAMGVKEFEWLHSGGGKEPRELHLRLSGHTFRMDDPPVIDDRTGERGFPGQLINCRCRMIPVVKFGGGK